jgi:hypothetical protein
LLAVSAAAIAQGPSSRGKLKGKTSQGRRIVLAASSGGLKVKHFTVRLRCHDGSTLIDQESGFQKTKLRSGGSFKDRQLGSTDEVRFQGHMHGHTVHGRLRVRDKLGHVRCDSRWVRFTAR